MSLLTPLCLPPICNAQHFVRRLHAHVASQAVQSVWPALHARLRDAHSAAARTTGSGSGGDGGGGGGLALGISIEQLHALHAEYLDRILEQCFLLPKMRAVLGHLHTMLSLALRFRAGMGRWLRRRWHAQRERRAAHRAAQGDIGVSSESDEDTCSDGVEAEEEGQKEEETPLSGSGDADLEAMEESLLDIHKQFGQRRRWVVIMVAKFVEVADASSRAAPWLSELLDGINFNGFVKKT